MTKKEFDDLIAEQREKGLTDEDIAKVFALMFKDGKLTREQIEGVLDAMGYELTDEARGMTDEEFKERILVEKEPEDEEGDKPAPKAKKEDGSDEAEEETEVEEETKTKETEDGDEEKEERSKAMKLFRFED